MEDFEKELKILINKCSKENESNTPDWLLAQFLNNCLIAFNVAVQQREAWYNNSLNQILQESSIKNGNTTVRKYKGACSICGSRLYEVEDGLSKEKYECDNSHVEW